MSAAYSEIARSLENFPDEATLRIAMRAHFLGLPVERIQTLVRRGIGRQIGQMPKKVPLFQEGIPNRPEDAALLGTEVIVANLLKDLSDANRRS